MADKRITTLNKLLDPQETDLLLIVDNALESPVNKRITVGDLFNKQSSNIASTSTAGKQRVKRELSVRGDVVLRNQSVIEQPITISVSGINDIFVPHSVGTYSGTEASVFIIEIDDASSSPNTFKWSKDGGSYTTAVDCTTDDGIALSNGINVAFSSTTGHTLGDKWYITAFGPSAVDFNGRLIVEDENLHVQDFSNEGSLQLESGVDIALENSVGGVDKDLLITANNTTIKIVGDQQHGSSTSNVGFFGSSPVSKNTTSFTGATVAQVITELQRLGMIG